MQVRKTKIRDIGKCGGMSLVRDIHGIPHIKSERRADNGNVPELDGE